jgi:membrane protease YdiL (CAAX protease family)
MSQEQDPVSEHRPPTVKELLTVTTIAYAVMAFVGFEVCWWYHKNAQARFGRITYDWSRLTQIVIAGFLFLYVCQLAMEHWMPSYRKFKGTLARLFFGVTRMGAAWLALTSSLGEEILFRGAIQPVIGIWLTSIGFGLLHLDPEGGISAWTIWAVLAGLLLGAMVDVTGSLWPGILVHFLINFVGILGLSKINAQAPRRT